MTPEQIAELERLEKLATAGPWESSGYTIRAQLRRQTVDGGYIEYRPYVANSIAGSLSGDDRRVNMALIAAVRNALPDLLAAAKENERLRKALEMCAESLAFARDKLGMCGEGDGAARKADAPDDIGSLPALTAARRALEGETP